MTEKFKLARDLYFHFMSDVKNIGDTTPEQRRQAFDTVAKVSIEMTEAFFKRIDEQHD